MALLNGPGEVDSLDYRSRHEYWLKQIFVNTQAAAAAAIATTAPIATTSRVLINAIDIEMAITPRYQVAANSSRTRCRIANNATASPTTPCDVVVGYSSISGTAWDQIVRPGESVLLDAPALAFSIAAISATPGSIGGGVIITSYLI